MKILSGKDAYLNLSERYNIAYTNGGRWFDQLVNCVRYAVPTMDGLNILYSYNDSGRYLNYYVDNDIPQIAADKRASQLHSLLLPIGKKWGSIYTDGQYNDLATTKVFEILQDSNIHSIAHSLFLDITIGCGAIWIDSSEKKPLNFKALTGVAVLPEYDSNDIGKNVWFRRAISDIELKSYKNISNNYQGVENRNFVTCGFIFNRKHDGSPIYKVKDGDKYKWLYIEILNDEWTVPLTFEARKFKQLHLINDTVRAGDTRGTGIALKMLNDIVYLNRLTKNLKKQVEFKSNPPLLANPKIGNFSFHNMTGGILPSTLGLDGVPLLEPLQWEVDIASVFKIKIDLEDRINMAFNVMPFGSVNTTPVRTATEIAAREADAQRQSVTDVSRMVFDFQNVFKTCLDILIARGILKGSNHEFTFKNPTLKESSDDDLNNLVTYKQLIDQVISPQFSEIANNSLAIDNYIKTKLEIPNQINNPPSVIQKGMELLAQNAMQQQTSEPTQQPSALQPAQFGQEFTQRGFGI